MIVNVRLEVTDEQRSVLSLRLFPKAAKRLATRGEFNELMQDHLLHLTQPAAQSRCTEQRPVLSDDGPALLSPDVVGSPEPFPIVAFDEAETTEGTTKYVKLLLSITNAMHSMTNAAMIAKQMLSPNDAQPFRDCRAKITDLRYEIADKHDAEMESQL